MRSARGGEFAGGKCESERACQPANVYAGKSLKSRAGKCIVRGDALSSGLTSDWPGQLRV